MKRARGHVAGKEPEPQLELLRRVGWRVMEHQASQIHLNPMNSARVRRSKAPQRLM